MENNKKKTSDNELDGNNELDSVFSLNQLSCYCHSDRRPHDTKMFSSFSEPPSQCYDGIIDLQMKRTES